ncbi:MAG: TM2 domain-containing protein [Bacteroidales bacterium]|jgi:TM2 domain-containing membrane protein YozV|nr:TM2 domain-containing protein [Bacteroidales bacterium]
MKKLLFALIAFVAISTVASAAPYKIDDAAVDNAIESAVEVSPVSFLSEVPAQLPAGMPASASVSAGKSPVGAILLTFFLGGFGVHRHYMGTRPWMWAIYTFTVGGIFGVVPFVDFIVEIVAAVEDNSVARYCGNTSFFMWG